jgi:large subunit ribosomal protein L23
MKHVYDVIRRPLFTEKGAFIKERDNQLLIEVAPEANKFEIKAAIEDLFKVKVAKIATVKQRGKLKRQGRHSGMTPDRKKAIVTLKKGEKLDFIEGV